MFTGIIEEVGELVAVEPFGGGRSLRVRASLAPSLGVDDSIAINGACQTVVAVDGDTFGVIAVEETLRKTTFGRLEAGMPVNLERAMPAAGRLDGHFVLGHVDATGVVHAIEKEETNWLIDVEFDPGFASYVIPAGSIALDGISLTIARLVHNRLTVAIIPHTYEHTNVATWTVGGTINLEFDMIGKYVVRWLETRNAEP